MNTFCEHASTLFCRLVLHYCYLGNGCIPYNVTVCWSCEKILYYYEFQIGDNVHLSFKSFVKYYKNKEFFVCFLFFYSFPILRWAAREVTVSFSLSVCMFNLFVWMKFLSQVLHLKGFPSVWYLICIMRLGGLFTFFSHCLHE